MRWLPCTTTRRTVSPPPPPAVCARTGTVTRIASSRTGKIAAFSHGIGFTRISFIVSGWLMGQLLKGLSVGVKLGYQPGEKLDDLEVDVIVPGREDHQAEHHRQPEAEGDLLAPLGKRSAARRLDAVEQQ